MSDALKPPASFIEMPTNDGQMPWERFVNPDSEPA